MTLLFISGAAFSTKELENITNLNKSKRVLYIIRVKKKLARIIYQTLVARSRSLMNTVG
jgi:hypothetical protein